MGHFWRPLGLWGLLAAGGIFLASCSRKTEKEALPSPRPCPLTLGYEPKKTAPPRRPGTLREAPWENLLLPSVA